MPPAPPRRPRRWSPRLLAIVVLAAGYTSAYVAYRAAGTIPFSTSTCICGRTHVGLRDHTDAPGAGWRGAAFAPLISVELLWRNRVQAR